MNILRLLWRGRLRGEICNIWNYWKQILSTLGFKLNSSGDVKARLNETGTNKVYRLPRSWT